MAGTYDIEDASWGWQWVCSPIAGYTAIELVSEICTGCPIAGAGLSGPAARKPRLAATRTATITVGRSGTV